MARILHIFLAILRFLRSPGAFLARRFRSFISIFVFLSRNLAICRSWYGNLRSSQRPKPAQSLPPNAGESPGLNSLIDSKGCVLASGSLPRLPSCEAPSATGQPATPGIICTPASPIVDPFHGHTHFSASSTFPALDSNMPNPISPSVSPGADDGLPLIVQANSHGSLHPSADQPSRSFGFACPQSDGDSFFSGQGTPPSTSTGRAGYPLPRLNTALEPHVSDGTHSGTILPDTNITQSPEEQVLQHEATCPQDVDVRPFNSYEVPRYSKCSTV
jgi:hypothetical protein